jgi:hypothetical protein
MFGGKTSELLSNGKPVDPPPFWWIVVGEFRWSLDGREFCTYRCLKLGSAFLHLVWIGCGLFGFYLLAQSGLPRKNLLILLDGGLTFAPLVGITIGELFASMFRSRDR